MVINGLSSRTLPMRNRSKRRNKRTNDVVWRMKVTVVAVEMAVAAAIAIVAHLVKQVRPPP